MGLFFVWGSLLGGTTAKSLILGVFLEVCVRVCVMDGCVCWGLSFLFGSKRDQRGKYSEHAYPDVLLELDLFLPEPISFGCPFSFAGTPSQCCLLVRSTAGSLPQYVSVFQEFVI